MKDAKSKKLIFVHNNEIRDTNCDVRIILRYLKRLTELGIKNDIVDTKEMSKSERMKLYFDAIVGSVMQKAAIRKQFGSNRDPGFMFWKTTPKIYFDNIENPKYLVFNEECLSGPIDKKTVVKISLR